MVYSDVSCALGAAVLALLLVSTGVQAQDRPAQSGAEGRDAAPIEPSECAARFQSAPIRHRSRLMAELCIDPATMFSSDDRSGLKDLDEPGCTIRTEQQVIDAAIASFVDADGSKQRSYDKGLCAGLGGPPCVNPFPYRSLAEFKAENPSCCRVLTIIPGDMPLTYRPNLRGEKEPRMYLVSLEFQAFTKGEQGARQPYRHKTLRIIDCSGKIMRGDVP